MLKHIVFINKITQLDGNSQHKIHHGQHSSVRSKKRVTVRPLSYFAVRLFFWSLLHGLKEFCAAKDRYSTLQDLCVPLFLFPFLVRLLDVHRTACQGINYSQSTKKQTSLVFISNDWVFLNRLYTPHKLSQLPAKSVSNDREVDSSRSPYKLNSFSSKRMQMKL